MNIRRQAHSSSNAPAPPAEARSAFDEIVSEIVARPLTDVKRELRGLEDKLSAADEEALRELRGTRRELSEYIGKRGVGSTATLFGLIGDPEDPDDGTLAKQLDRIGHEIGDTAAAGSREHERIETLISDAVQHMATHHGDLRAWLADQGEAQEASTALQFREITTALAEVRDLGSAQSHALHQLRTRQQQDSAQAIETITAAADSIRLDLSTTTADITSATQEQRQLAQQSAHALSTKIHLLTLLVILQGVGLTALMLLG